MYAAFIFHSLLRLPGAIFYLLIPPTKSPSDHMPQNKSVTHVGDAIKVGTEKGGKIFIINVDIVQTGGIANKEKSAVVQCICVNASLTKDREEAKG